MPKPNQAKTETNWFEYYYKIKKNKYLRALSLAMMIVGGVICIAWIIPAMLGYIPVPINFDIFGFQLRIYTVFVILGMLLAVMVFEYLKYNYQVLAEVDVWTALIYMLIPGIFAARAYYVITEWQSLNSNWLEFIRIDGGGLSIIGGFGGGLLGLYLYARRNKINWRALISAIAVVLPLAQFVGRFGNFFNKELFGFPTQVPWAMFVPTIHRPIIFLREPFYHPLFIYEAIPNLVLFIVLIGYWQHLRTKPAKFAAAIRTGFFIRIYIISYMTLRFMLDFYRIEGGLRIYGLTLTQVLYLVGLLGIIIFGTCYQIWFRYKRGTWFTRHEQLINIK